MKFKKFFQRDELKLLWPFYVESLILSIFFIVFPFQVFYFLSIGFNLFQVGLLTSAQLLAAFLFEIPTGAVADIFGRKISTIIGQFLAGAAILAVFFTDNFFIIFTLMFIWGLAQTFVSGAYEAWIVDKLKQKKQDHLIQEYYSKTHSFYNLSLLIAGILGAFLVKIYGLKIVWPITSICFFTVGIMLMFVSENHKRKKANLKQHFAEFKNQTTSSIKYSFKNKNIRLLLFAALLFGALVPLTTDLTWTAFFKDLGIQEHWIGYLFSLTMVVGIFTPHLVKGLVKKLGGYKNHLMAVLSLMLSFLIMTLFISGLAQAIIMFILLVAMWDFYLPAKTPFFQSFVPSKMRATINSINSQIRSLMGIIVTPLVGLIADIIGPQYTISLGAIFLIPIIYIYSKVKEKK